MDLFSSPKPKPAKQQIVTPPPVMPVADDAAVQAAKRARLEQAMARHGRASTNLAPDNAGTVLGG